MGEQCNNHDACMERINENMKKIEVSYAGTQGEIAGFTKYVKEFLEAIRKDIYAPDGLVTKSSKNSNQISLQWGVLMFILVAIVGTAIAIIVK